MITTSNNLIAVGWGVGALVLTPHVAQAIADVLISPLHSLQVVIAMSGFQDGEFVPVRYNVRSNNFH
jgi:hypothetical protein